MKTAVEWLVEKHFGSIENCSPNFRKHIEQAKAMEREQKIEFAEKMRLIQDVDFDGNVTFAFDIRTHLETFKSE